MRGVLFVCFFKENSYNSGDFPKLNMTGSLFSKYIKKNLPVRRGKVGLECVHTQDNLELFNKISFSNVRPGRFLNMVQRIEYNQGLKFLC